MQGTVTRWLEKGYGFIHGDDNKTYFAHQRDIQMKGFRYLTVNQRVSFEESTNEKGYMAVKIVPMGGE